MDYFVEDALRLQDVAPYYDFGCDSGCDSARHLVDFCFPHPLVHSDRAVVLAHEVVVHFGVYSDRVVALAHVAVVH